jgi:peptide/nickel transport system ATP-binding protein
MLLRVENLTTEFENPYGLIRAVDGVSFEIPRGKTLALVGESGCGKSVTALSIMRLVPSPGRVTSGRILFEDRDLLQLAPAEMRRVRGRRIAMIFQEPMTSLNPVLTVGAQIREALAAHRASGWMAGPNPIANLGRRRADRSATIGLLKHVGIPAAESRVNEYPHRLSGGMRQRVMIAMALAGGPALLIADEPTTALDVTVQAQILALLRRLQDETGLAILLVTHDLGVVAQMADEVGVMYAGRLVERAAAGAILSAPRHPYTQALLRSLPRLRSRPADGPARRLPVIPGEIPDPLNRPPGCPFEPRCEHPGKDGRCTNAAPPLEMLAPHHSCACWQASAS